MQMYIHIFTQIQLRLNRCDPAEWIGNKIELPASPTVTAPHGMGKHMNYCHHLQIVSIVSGDMTLKTLFSVPGQSLHCYQYQVLCNLRNFLSFRRKIKYLKWCVITVLLIKFILLVARGTGYTSSEHRGDQGLIMAYTMSCQQRKDAVQELPNTQGKTPLLSLCENPTHICHRLIFWHPSQQQQLCFVFFCISFLYCCFSDGPSRGSLLYHSYASKIILKSVILESKLFKYSLL